MTAEPADSRRYALAMRRLLFGHLQSRAVCAAVAVGVPDLLGGGSMTAPDIAARTGADPAAMHRLLRALMAFGVLSEQADGGFALTPFGANLRSDAPGTSAPTALLIEHAVGPAWNAMVETVRTGQPAFERLFGKGFFEFLNESPDLRRIFDRSQASGLELELDQLMATITIPTDATVVDVGGGDGALLEHVLINRVDCRGVLIDLEPVLDGARQRLAEAGLLERCDLWPEDFLAHVPPGGDVYILRHILHDWSDQECLAVLQACQKAVPPHGILVIVEMTMADHGSPGPDLATAAAMDLYMMSLFGDGGERTLAEITCLLNTSGLAVSSVTPAVDGTSIILVRPI